MGRVNVNLGSVGVVLLVSGAGIALRVAFNATSYGQRNAGWMIFVVFGTLFLTILRIVAVVVRSSGEGLAYPAVVAAVIIVGAMLFRPLDSLAIGVLLTVGLALGRHAGEFEGARAHPATIAELATRGSASSSSTGYPGTRSELRLRFEELERDPYA
jgi:hypothetical protein